MVQRPHSKHACSFCRHPVIPVETALQDSFRIQHFFLDRGTCQVAGIARQHYHSCIVADFPERIPL